MKGLGPLLNRLRPTADTGPRHVPNTTLPAPRTRGPPPSPPTRVTLRPPGEKWALLVNEFGSLGIDAALLEAELQEAAGGQQEAEEQQPGQGGGGGAGGAGASSISSSNTSTITGTSSSSISTSGGPTGSSGISGSGSGGGYVVRELAGGCMCCTLSGPLGVAIAQLVRTAKPDRLIIEPSGLGHPAGGGGGEGSRGGGGVLM